MSQAILRTLDPGNTGSQCISGTLDPGYTGNALICICICICMMYILGQEHFSESASRKTLILHISLNPDILLFWQKRRAPKNAAFWRASRAEISHMRSIQGRKLKLIIWVVSQSTQLMGSTSIPPPQAWGTSSRVGIKAFGPVPASGLRPKL